MNALQTLGVRGHTSVPPHILPTLVLAQFACTSLWFAVNAVMPDLQRDWGLPASAVATLTSAVQLGFVAGTLVFALLMLSDRFPPTRVFLVCALLAAMANAGLLLVNGRLPGDWGWLLVLRFVVGFLLAGIYPVGMKIAASWYRQGLGLAMGFLIGALVLGTALPHGLRALAVSALVGSVPWQGVVVAVSALAVCGGLAVGMLLPPAPVPVGARPGVAPIQIKALGMIGSDRLLRASVLGYWGHMWELYAFFVLVPTVVASRVYTEVAASAWAFAVIAAGFIGCVLGGWAAQHRRVVQGSARVAQVQLATSAGCCLVAPLMLVAPLPVFAVWLLLWGMTVAGDSPQFSTLTAQNAPPAVVGSVLTLSNCIGFAISVVSIQLFVAAAQIWPLAWVLPWLALGPLVGLWALRPLLRVGTSA